MRLLDSLLTNRTPDSVQGSRIPRMDGAYPDSLDIEDGYPSDERVNEIRMIGARQAAAWLVDVFPSEYSALPYGGVDVIEEASRHGRPVVNISVWTGGWSGCESVIYAILDNFWLARFVRVQERGGGYVIEVSHENLAESREACSRDSANV